MFDFRKLVSKYLREVANRVDSEECELSKTEAMDILSVIAHESLSKEESCQYLNTSRSRFDELVRTGNLPKGRKRVGYKELSWFKNELDNYLYFKEYGNKKNRETQASSSKGRGYKKP